MGGTAGFSGVLLFAARLHSPCEPNKLRDRLVRASREGQLARDHL